MTENRVIAVGFVVSPSEESRSALRVEFWFRMAGSGSTERTTYDPLSWAEALDVVSAELETHRPGWAVGDGWAQPPLFE